MAFKKNRFKPSASAENQFARSLRKIARVSGHLVDAHVDGHKIVGEKEMQDALKAYSKTIGPWASSQASKMLAQVSKSNLKSYTQKSKEIGQRLKLTVSQGDVGFLANALMREQVDLITSIPLRAGIRAQQLAMEAIYDGSRASEIAEALQKTTEVSESNAIRIARTEVARANASLTQARATLVGAQGYFWRTTMDGAERESHAKMNNKYVLYSEVPTLSDGTKGHAGTLINCRCWQDVQFDDDAE